jgi:Leucine-rich repeat (LRR) protein
MEKMSFSHNIIDTVVNGVFGNTTNLLHLDLSYNKIKGSVLHTEPFYLDIGQLRKLNLRGNDLETIDDETFSPFGISNIEYLDISLTVIILLKLISSVSKLMSPVKESSNFVNKL